VAAMILNPHAQARAQQELDAVVGYLTLPRISDRERLPYTRGLINEIFRLYPVVPLGEHFLVQEVYNKRFNLIRLRLCLLPIH
jgi:cytochrome P450